MNTEDYLRDILSEQTFQEGDSELTTLRDHRNDVDQSLLKIFTVHPLGWLHGEEYDHQGLLRWGHDRLLSRGRD